MRNNATDSDKSTADGRKLSCYACDECGENGRFLNESLVESLASLPADELPDDWESMPLDERFKLALERGLIQMTRK